MDRRKTSLTGSSAVNVKGFKKAGASSSVGSRQKTILGAVTHSVAECRKVKIMLNWIRKYIIGGATGTTELAMLAFFGVGAMTLFAVWEESEGVMMENTFNLLIFLWPSIGARPRIHR